MQNEPIYLDSFSRDFRIRNEEKTSLNYMIDDIATKIIKKYNLYEIINSYINIISSLLESFSSQYGISYFIGLRGEIDPEDNSEEVVVEIMIKGSYDFNFKRMIWKTIEDYVSMIEKNLPEDKRELSLEHIAIKVI